MKNNALKYTIVHHDLRMKFDLTPLQYMVLDLISCLSNNGKSVGGWCYASKRYMSENLGVSKRHIITIINSLVKKELIEKHSDNPKLLRAVHSWIDAIKIKSEQTSPKVNREHLRGEQISPDSDEQTSPPSYRDKEISTEDNNKDKKYFSDLFNEAKVTKLPLENWREWCDYKIEVKNKLTKSTAKKQLEFLSEQPNPVACIDQSIKNQWKGIFPIEGQNNGNTNSGFTYKGQSNNKVFQVNT